MEKNEAMRSRLKRQFLEGEDDSNKPPEKKIRFPKGKKVKTGDEVSKVVIETLVAEEPSDDLADPRVAAKERAKRRSQMTTELFSEGNRVEVDYDENNNTFVDDGIQIEPFNLKQEMEEGYFDADGNFVEYVKNEKEIKDAWLDSVDAVFTDKSSYIEDAEEEADDLSSGDVQKIRRRIADVLEPRETVLHALRRLKGSTNGKKDKMSDESKHLFDRLTEDSMKLIDNGCRDAYHFRREVFESDVDLFKSKAEDFEREEAAGILDQEDFQIEAGQAFQVETGPLLDDNDTYDIFGEDDENPTTTDHNGVGSASEPDIQASSGNLHTNLESGDAGNDYVLDDSSGYYYSSSLGYYYDPVSGLYCSASTGKWYSFNEQTSTYEEIRGESEVSVT